MSDKRTKRKLMNTAGAIWSAAQVPTCDSNAMEQQNSYSNPEPKISFSTYLFTAAVAPVAITIGADTTTASPFGIFARSGFISIFASPSASAAIKNKYVFPALRNGTCIDVFAVPNLPT